MITQITSDNKQAYVNLFEEATKLLLKEKIPNFSTPITTLEEYFVWLPTLANLSDEISQYGLKYTILPLDEGYFQIDANSRKIEIPTEFKKNGIAVQGDHGAETIYFKIARYFDYQDLNECEIYIQWKEINNDNNGGVMRSIVRDIESDPDNLIFGWPLLSNITENAGSISFSIRFIKTSDGTDGKKKLDYSFSTLDAIATINPALNEAWETMQAEASLFDTQYKDLTKRLTAAKRTGEAAPAMPYFTVMLIDGDDQFDSDAVSILEEFTEENDYTYTADLIGEYGSAKLYFAVQAEKDDTGTLTYKWTKDDTEYNGNSSVQYAAIIGTESPTSRVYYIKNKEGAMVELSKIDATDTWADVRTEYELETDTPIYYQTYTILEITEPGKYRSKVSNINSATNGITEKLSYPLDIPKPTEPKLVVAEEKNYIINSGTTTTLSVELKPLADNDTTQYDYSWYQTVAENQVNVGENQSRIEIGEQGTYWCQIVGKRNNESTKEESSNLYQVSYPPLSIEITEVLNTVTGYSTLKTGQALQVNAKLLDSGYTQLAQFNPTISYQWFNGPDGTNPIEGATEQTYIYNTAGTYSVGAYNTYNNQQTSNIINFTVNN